MSDCIFCKIASGEIETDKVYEDERIIAFKDMEPQAPVHILVIPKHHIESLDDVKAGDAPLIGDLMCKIKGIAKEAGIENGYRVVNNCGENGFQTVKHIHFHLLGNKRMGWPPYTEIEG